MRHRWLSALVTTLLLAGCATAEDLELPGRPHASPDASPDVTIDASPPVSDASTGDGGSDTTTPPDTTTPADSGAPDTGPVDTGASDTGTIDTGDPDTGTIDTGAPDTGVVDTGVGGGCMYCSTGSCVLPLQDYGCLLDCIVMGYFDCDYQWTTTTCTCK